MRILLLTDRFPEHPGTTAVDWLSEHVRSLATFAEVDVFAFPRILPRVKGLLRPWGSPYAGGPRIFPIRQVRHEGRIRVEFRRTFSFPDTISWSLTPRLLVFQHAAALRGHCRRRPPDVILVHFTHPSTALARLLGGQCDTPVCVAANDTPAVYAAEGKHRAVRWMARQLRHADVVITQCATHRDAVQAVTRPRRIAVIPPGVRASGPAEHDPDPAMPMPGAVPAGAPPFWCLFAARLDDPLKRLDLALEALAAARERSGIDIRLTVAGSGALRRRSERFVQKRGIAAAVDFVGWVSSGEMPGLYRRHHLLVFPSEVESFGLVLLEAAAAGLPIVAGGRTGAVPEIRQETDGVVALKEISSGEITAAIVRCIETYPALAAAARAGRQNILRRFSWEEHARRYEDLLTGLKKNPVRQPEG